MKRLKNGFLTVAAMLLLIMVMASAAMATTVDYTLTGLGGSMFRYDWTVTANPLEDPIQDMLIYFEDVTTPTADTLSVVGVPNSDWIAAVYEPFIPVLGGYYEAYTLTTPIAPGSSLSGFSASFNWLLQTRGPGSQLFEIYEYNANTDTLDLVESGQTTQRNDGVVPEASTFVAFGSLISFLAAGARLRRRS